MLVLTRKPEQQIQVGDNITITILQVNGRSVRVGIDAPRDVRILRGELRPGQTAHLGVTEAAVPLPSVRAAVVRQPNDLASVRLASPKAITDQRDQLRRVPGDSVSNTSSSSPHRLGPTSLQTMLAARHG